MKIVALIAMALLGAPTITSAGELAPTSDAHFRVLPEPPREGEPLVLHIDNDAGCFDGGDQADIYRNGGEVAVHFFGVDHACPPSRNTPLSVPLGQWARGTYTLVVRLCPAPPFECVEIDRQSIIVLPPPKRFTVPALTTGGMVAVALAILAAFLVGRKRS